MEKNEEKKINETPAELIGQELDEHALLIKKKKAERDLRHKAAVEAEKNKPNLQT